MRISVLRQLDEGKNTGDGSLCQAAKQIWEAGQPAS